jgi:hypothetical protein
MKRVLLAAVLVLLGAMLCCANAEMSGPRFTVYGSLAMPTGDFGDDSGMDAGLATMGFGGGAEFCYPFGAEGLSWATSAWFIMNGVDDDGMVDQLLGEFPSGYDASGSVDVGSYINFPVMTGIRYDAAVSDAASIYGIGQLGLNFLKVPNAEICLSVSGWGEFVDMEGEMEYDMGTSLGLCLGGGIVVNETFDLGFRLLMLGESSLEGTFEGSMTYGDDWDQWTENFSEDLEAEQPVSVLLVTAGVTF